MLKTLCSGRIINLNVVLEIRREEDTLFLRSLCENLTGDVSLDVVFQVGPMTISSENTIKF